MMVEQIWGMLDSLTGTLDDPVASFGTHGQVGMSGMYSDPSSGKAFTQSLSGALPEVPAALQPGYFGQSEAQQGSRTTKNLLISGPPVVQRSTEVDKAEHHSTKQDQSFSESEGEDNEQFVKSLDEKVGDVDEEMVHSEQERKLLEEGNEDESPEISPEEDKV